MAKIPKAGDHFHQLSARALADAVRAGAAFREGKLAPQNKRLPQHPPLGAEQVRIRNDTSEELEAYSVIGIGDMLNLPVVVGGTYTPESLRAFHRLEIYSAQLPDPKEHWGRFGITTNAIRKGELGSAIIRGTTRCRVRVPDSFEQLLFDRAGLVKEDLTALHVHPGGSAQILSINYDEIPTDRIAWAIVHLGEIPDGWVPIRNRTSGPIPPFACVTVREAFTSPYYDVWRPYPVANSNQEHRTLLNGSTQIGPEEFGYATFGRGWARLKDVNAHPPEVGENFGPVDNEWYLSDRSEISQFSSPGEWRVLGYECEGAPVIAGTEHFVPVYPMHPTQLLCETAEDLNPADPDQPYQARILEGLGFNDSDALLPVFYDYFHGDPAEAIPENTKILVDYHRDPESGSGKWRYVGGDCV